MTTRHLVFIMFSLLNTSILFSQGTPHEKLIIDSIAKPQLFAEGVISTPYTEWSLSFSPDNKTVYTSRGSIYWTIIYSELSNGKWQKPLVATFSGKWRDTDPFVSPDGNKLFFISNRPLDESTQDKPQTCFHVWYVDKKDNAWGIPHHLDSLINIDGISNYAPSVDNKGNLYFCSRDREGHPGMTGYCANFKDGKYEKPVIITLKGFDEVQDPFINPDDKYLIFINGNDLYVTYNANNEWTVPEKLSTKVNNGDGNSSPYVSHDGKMLYYSSSRIQGFYKRNPKDHTVNYEELLKENVSCFNGQSNILKIPAHFTKG